MSLADSTDFTLAALLREQTIKQPEAPAILAPGRSALSFAGLWQQVSELAAALQALGATPSTRVAVVLPNGPELASAFLGTATCSTCAPLNPAYQAAEFRFHLEDLRARIVIVRAGEFGPVVTVAKELGLAVLKIEPDAALPAGKFCIAASPADRAAPAQLPGPQDVALILHTSGTTARPKLIPLSHANLVSSARCIARHLALQPSDRCLNVMPLFHVHGLVGALLASVAGGGSIVCTPGFDDLAFFDWTAQFEPTWYTAVPTIHQLVVANGALYRQKAPAHRFRFVRSSSSALPPKVFEMLQELTGAPVVEAYGLTEASHQIASNPLPPGTSKPGSVGIAAGADVALVDDAGQLLGPGSTGEIVIRGPGVTAGYVNYPLANAKSFTDGWFRTGDQGRFDDDGYLFIAGRIDESPRTKLERSLEASFRKVLGCGALGAHDDFFELGGHSLLAFRLLAEIKRTLGSVVPVYRFFQASTIRKLAAVIQQQGGRPISCVVAVQPYGTRPRLFAVSGYGGGIMPFKALARELGMDQPLCTLDTGVFGDNDFTPEELARRMVADMREVQPTGPYQLVGYSLGGMIVYEIARQLGLAGQQLALLALLDCAPPGYPKRAPFVMRVLLHLRHGLALRPAQAWRYLAERVWRLRKYVVSIDSKLFDGDAEASMPPAKAMQQSADAVGRAWDRYVPTFYPGPALLVRAEVRPSYPGVIDDDPEMGWGSLVGGGVRLESLHCGHIEMLHPENARALAAVLVKHLVLRETPPARTYEAVRADARLSAGRSCAASNVCSTQI